MVGSGTKKLSYSTWLKFGIRGQKVVVAYYLLFQRNCQYNIGLSDTAGVCGSERISRLLQCTTTKLDIQRGDFGI